LPGCNEIKVSIPFLSLPFTGSGYSLFVSGLREIETDVVSMVLVELRKIDTLKIKLFQKPAHKIFIISSVI